MSEYTSPYYWQYYQNNPYAYGSYGATTTSATQQALAQANSIYQPAFGSVQNTTAVYPTTTTANTTASEAARQEAITADTVEEYAKTSKKLRQKLEREVREESRALEEAREKDQGLAGQVVDGLSKLPVLNLLFSPEGTPEAAQLALDEKRAQIRDLKKQERGQGEYRHYTETERIVAANETAMSLTGYGLDDFQNSDDLMNNAADLAGITGYTERYITNRQDRAEIVYDILATGVAVGAAAFTGGGSLALAAPVLAGGGTKLALSMADANGSGWEYDAGDAVHNFATGALSGAMSLIFPGAGASVLTSTAERAAAGAGVKTFAAAVGRTALHGAYTGAIEGGLSQVSRSVLRDHEDLGEGITDGLHAAAGGAIFGGVLGGVAGGATYIGSRIKAGNASAVIPEGNRGEMLRNSRVSAMTEDRLGVKTTGILDPRHKANRLVRWLIDNTEETGNYTWNPLDRNSVFRNPVGAVKNQTAKGIADIVNEVTGVDLLDPDSLVNSMDGAASNVTARAAGAMDGNGFVQSTLGGDAAKAVAQGEALIQANSAANKIERIIDRLGDSQPTARQTETLRDLLNKLNDYSIEAANHYESLLESNYRVSLGNNYRAALQEIRTATPDLSEVTQDAVQDAISNHRVKLYKELIAKQLNVSMDQLGDIVDAGTAMNYIKNNGRLSQALQQASIDRTAAQNLIQYRSWVGRYLRENNTTVPAWNVPPNGGFLQPNTRISSVISDNAFAANIGLNAINFSLNDDQNEPFAGGVRFFS